MKNFVLGDAAYNKMKFVALVLLPAVGTLYFALAGVWNLPDAEQVVGTITIVDTFLGALLHISTAQYNAGGGNADGTYTVKGKDPETGMPDVGVTFSNDPKELMKQKHVRLRVVEHNAAA